MMTLGHIAEQLGLLLKGDANVEITALAPLSQATGQHLSFVAKAGSLSELADCRAGAVIVKGDWAEHWTGSYLVSDNPYLAYAKATHLFDNRPTLSQKIHERALISPHATLGSDVTVDAGAVVEAGVTIGEGAWIGANVYVGQDSHIGAHSRVYPGTVLYHGVRVGHHCTVHANAVIGADGFGFAPCADGWTKIVQLGGVRIGNWVEIGAGTTIDRGALNDTVVDDNVILDDQVHIAHNVHIGARTGIAACTGVAGSTVIGQDCTLAGMVGVGDHLTLADNVHVNGQCRVSRSLTEPGLYAPGTAIQPYSKWSRSAVRFEQLDEMAKRLKTLEKQLGALAPSSSRHRGDAS